MTRIGVERVPGAESVPVHLFGTWTLHRRFDDAAVAGIGIGRHARKRRLRGEHQWQGEQQAGRLCHRRSIRRAKKRTSAPGHGLVRRDYFLGAGE
jgi:hypothetical protein